MQVIQRDPGSSSFLSMKWTVFLSVKLGPSVMSFLEHSSIGAIHMVQYQQRGEIGFGVTQG